MAVTVTKLTESQGQRTRQTVCTVLFDSSYPTGGEAITANQVGLSRITGAIVSPAGTVAAGAIVGVWDQANSKILAFQGDNNNAADAPLIEVPDTTDLAAFTFTVQFFGI